MKRFRGRDVRSREDEPELADRLASTAQISRGAWRESGVATSAREVCTQGLHAVRTLPRRRELSHQRQTIRVRVSGVHRGGRAEVVGKNVAHEGVDRAIPRHEGEPRTARGNRRRSDTAHDRRGRCDAQRRAAVRPTPRRGATDRVPQGRALRSIRCRRCRRVDRRRPRLDNHWRTAKTLRHAYDPVTLFPCHRNRCRDRRGTGL